MNDISQNILINSFMSRKRESLKAIAAVAPAINAKQDEISISLCG